LSPFPPKIPAAAAATAAYFNRTRASMTFPAQIPPAMPFFGLENGVQPFNQ